MSLNDFIFGKVLGKGSFGTVNIVTRKQDNKIYAMKRVNISRLSDKDKKSSLNEIRILASLNHPNIIDYKEAFFDEETKTLNIVMEFAEEGDIENKVKENFKHRLRFKEDTIWEWLIQILEGLKYLHDNKIMHRDLKCANIFLTKNGRLKLGDLNVSIIAKMGMAQTQTGTPYYCSPEIWNDRPYDYKSDIWSVGCIIYELCQLKPPFRGTNLRDLCRNVNRGYYLPISSYYSNELRQMISMMLVVDPNKRAGTDDLLLHPILQKRIQRVRKNIITREVKTGKSRKVNFMETIKLPRNLKDIKLPKKRYRPENEMMQNDEYETMKATFLQELKKQIGNNNNYNNFNNNDYNYLNNNYYYNQNNNKYDYDAHNDDRNYVNNGELINNYIRKSEQSKNNNQINNSNQNNNNYHPYNENKYQYINNCDNNMRLNRDFEEKQIIGNNNKNNYIDNYNNGKNANYHYKNNNYFDYPNNKNNRILENKYNDKNDMFNDNLYNYNNPYRMQNNNIYSDKNNNNFINNGNRNNAFNNENNYNGKINNKFNINENPSNNNNNYPISKYFQIKDNNQDSKNQNKNNYINEKSESPKKEININNINQIDLDNSYSNDSDILKDEYLVKKNEKQNNYDLNKNNYNYYNDKNKKNELQNDLYNKDLNNYYNKDNRNGYNKNDINMNYKESNGSKEHEIEKDIEKTKDLKQQMAQNQNLFDDLLYNENKLNIEENELFKENNPIEVKDNSNKNIYNINKNIDINQNDKINNNQINENIYIDKNNGINGINKINNYEILNRNDYEINNQNNNQNNNFYYNNNNIIDNKINNNINDNNNIYNNLNNLEKNNINENNKNNNSNVNNNKKNVKDLLHERLHQQNNCYRKNNNMYGKNNKNKRGITPNNFNNNRSKKINDSNNVKKIVNNNGIQNGENNNNKNGKEDKYKKIFNEVSDQFKNKPNNNVRRKKNNLRPESGKEKQIIFKAQNLGYANYNNNYQKNNYKNNNMIHPSNFINNNINYRINNNNFNINYNNNNINNYNNIYINNINDKFNYNINQNNDINNRINKFNPQINNNKGYIFKSEQPNYRIYNNFNNYNFQFKYEHVKRPNNKIEYNKVNYNEYRKKNNIDDKFQFFGENGYNYYKNALNELENNNIEKNRYNNKNINNKRMNHKNISEKNMNLRVKKGGGRNNGLYKKFGFN